MTSESNLSILQVIIMSIETGTTLSAELLDGFTGVKLLSRAESTDRLTPIGLIVYDHGKRMVHIASQTMTSPEPGNGEEPFQERLLTTYHDIPTEVNPDSVVGKSGRIIDLRSYDELMVAQIDLKDVTVTTFRSIRTHPSVAISVPYINPSDTQRDTIRVGEEDILEIFTGERGGIAVLHGMGLPEDNAMILEKDLNGKKHGLVFFFYPTDDPKIGLHSVEGFLEFINRLGTEFERNASIPLQYKVVQAFTKEISRGSFSFMPEAQRDIFKMVLIAHARMATKKPQERRYSDVLSSHLPSLKPRLIADITRLFTQAQRKPRAVQAIDRILSSGIEQPHVLHGENKDTDKRGGIIGKLQTERAIALRSDIASYLGGRNQPMVVYLNKLADMAEAAQTPQQFHDAGLLLKEAENFNTILGILDGNIIQYVPGAKEGEKILHLTQHYEAQTNEADRFGRKAITLIIAQMLDRKDEIFFGKKPLEVSERDNG